MDKIVLKGDIFMCSEIRCDNFLVIEDGVISMITDSYSGTYEDYTGMAIAPGLFDTHIHGFMGYDVMDGADESILKLSEVLPTMGVTNFLATTLTASKEDLDEVLKTVRRTKDAVTGAKLEGIFLEGPFFTEKYKGAQNPKYMGEPDIARLIEMQEISGGLVRKIAIAPEYENAEEFTALAKEMGVYVALGHTDATYEQTEKAVEAGASIFVHTYNAMRGLHHREPGVVGAAMNLKQTYSELITDGHHVHPVSANILMDVKGRDKIVMITDCMMAGGMKDGEYMLGEFKVNMCGGRPTLEDGALAGSVLKLSDGVKNTARWGIASLHQAIKMASYNAAVSVGLEDRIGSIDIGRPADLIIMDKSGNLKATYLDGKVVYSV